MNFSDYDSTFHSDPEQAKRIKSASSAKLTPLSVDFTTKTALFQGSTTQYDVSLDFCPCGDFRRRKLPCKHIYRLAMELGLYKHEYKSDVSQSKSRFSTISFADYIDIIEDFSEQSQRLLLSDLYNIIYKKDKYCCHSIDECQELVSANILVDFGVKEELLDFFSRNKLNDMISRLNVPFKKNMSQAALVAWCKNNLSDRYEELLSGYCATKINDDYTKHNSKLYKYLHRKYDFEMCWDYETDYSRNLRLLDTSLPEDVVTDQLIRKGFYHKSE